MTQVIRKLQFTLDEREASLLWAALTVAILTPALLAGTELKDEMLRNFEEAKRIMFEYSAIDGELPEEGQPLACVEKFMDWADDICNWEDSPDA